MSGQERSFRSKLAQLIGQKGLIRGTLLSRKRMCGKPSCRCTRGHPHESLYLVVSESGRTRQLYVPRAWEAAVRQWVRDYQQAKELMEEISRLHWDKIRNRRE
ncbi:MAG: hypothetical protein JXA11_15855 [Phycisphaerae bacterium]|nr:hypothetical protein [Phycisphaerae bacterium]